MTPLRIYVKNPRPNVCNTGDMVALSASGSALIVWDDDNISLVALSNIQRAPADKPSDEPDRDAIPVKGRKRG